MSSTNINLDELHFSPSDPDSALAFRSAQTPVLLYFITGNPGLPGYYHKFLKQLFLDLNSTGNRGEPSSQYHVYCHCLPGFELAAGEGGREATATPTSHPAPYSLQEVIVSVRQRIESVAETLARSRDGKGQRRLRLILIGHSVGTYIMLENIAFWQRERRRRWQVMQSSEPENLSRGTHGALDGCSYDIAGGICLFPTVLDIANSPRGKKVALFGLVHLPFVPALLQALVTLLVGWMPLTFLTSLVQKLIPSMTAEAAQTTARFLQSKTGVWQAISMGAHELREMGPDHWDDELWGVAAAGGSASPKQEASAAPIRPKLYFYWGADDWWVANATRDRTIAARAKTSRSGGQKSKKGGEEEEEQEEEDDDNRPFMEVDTKGVPHDFCINHEQPVRAKVVEYIRQIVGETQEVDD